MLMLDAETIHALVRMPCLIECLRQAFRRKVITPPRQVLQMPGGAGDRQFVCMPAFAPDGGAAVKLATIFPNNEAHGFPNMQAAIVLFSEMGTATALLDGTAVTHLRTGAASALASEYLSREDSAHLVIIGTGALAPSLVAAHCAVRPVSRISVWGRRSERAVATAAAIRSLVDRAVDVLVPESLEAAVADADIVSCATSSSTPILLGKWLKPGTFVDLVGSFSPSKREADDEVVRRSRIFVDTQAGALVEAGDLLDPLGRGIIDCDRIEGELADLVCGRTRGRLSPDEITLFKSVGSAIEDLAAARMIAMSALSDLGVGNSSRG